MSFTSTRKTIKAGDTALIYINPKMIYRITVTEGEKHQNRFGALNHEELIGKRFGSKINMPNGYVHVLDITPELWTLTLPHRTQILYPTDISMVLTQLELKPGSIVLEAGTGSGSLSHSIIRTIHPTGHLYTFDFHKQRSEIAEKEFNEHGLGHLVTARHRDVCGDGIYVEGNPPADACFLDLPQPWVAIPSAHKALKTGGRLCCFSPCMEQVQRTVKLLTELKFADIKMLECVERPCEVRKFYMKTFTEESLIATLSKNGEDDSKGPPMKKRRKFGENAPLEDNEFAFHSFYTPPSHPGHTGFLVFATRSAS